MTLAVKKKLKDQKRNILHLTLNRPPFDVMKTGEKVIEVRRPCKWIKSRLINSKTGKPRKYDFICFKNGYNTDSEFFYTEFVTFGVATIEHRFDFSNKLIVNVNEGDYLIYLGKTKTVEEVLTFYNKEDEGKF